MENEDGFCTRTAIRAWWLAAALGCLSLSAHAQQSFGDKIYWSSVSNKIAADVRRITGASPSTTLPPTGTPAVNGAKISNLAAAWPTADSKAPGPSASTRGAVFDVKARVVPSSVGPALGRLASKVFTPLAVGMAVYDFGQEMGFGLDNSTGVLVVQQQGGPTDIWSVGPVSGVTYQCRVTTVDQACPCAGLTWGGFTNYCMPGYKVPVKVAGTSAPGALSPSTLAAFEAAVNAKTGFSTSSAISRAIDQAIESGEVIDWDNVTVAGPASSAGPSSVTTKADGSVVTTTTTNNYTYNTNTVTVKTTTTVATYNPSTGTTTTDTTEETKPEEPGDCAKNPDSLACAELDTPTGDIPRDTETINFAEENVFGSGSCPSNLSASIATLGTTVTVWDWQKTCELALPLRALVLGLATFAALLIVMPGSNRT